MAYFLDFFEYALIGWLLILSVLVIRSVVFSGRPLDGLTTTDGGQSDPERVVLLLFTIGFAFYYFLTTATTPLDQLPGYPNETSLPDVSPEVLAVLFGAQSSYIIGKFLRIKGRRLL